MRVFIPIGWDPSASDAVLARWPRGCVLCAPPKADDAPVRDMLTVIYAVVSGRAPTQQELDRNRPLSPRVLERERTVLGMIESIERGELTAIASSVASTWEDEVRVWWDFEDGWQFLVAHRRVEGNSARPELGGWDAHLLTAMSPYGDDHDPSPELNARFQLEAAEQFSPGDLYQPPARDARRARGRSR